VTFREQEQADRALKEVNGFVLFGNKMVITTYLFLLDTQSFESIGLTICEVAQ
jgi:hypothetical protein